MYILHSVSPVNMGDFSPNLDTADGSAGPDSHTIVTYRRVRR